MNKKEKMDFLLENIRGIGPSKADKMVNGFPDIDTWFSLLDNTELQEHAKALVGEKLTASILTQLQNIQKQDEAVQMMVNCGIPYFSAVNIAKDALLFAAFKKDPWTIGREQGIPFESCDRFGHILFQNDPPDMSKVRMQSFINAMLLELENSGHTFAYLPQLAKKLNQYQKRRCYLPDTYEASTLLLYLVDNELVEVEKASNIKKWKVYRKETAELENDIAYHIKRLSLNCVSAAYKPFVSTKIKYDDVQLAAIQSASLSGLKVITGPPGSGKTAVINGIISYFKSIKEDAKIVLCAPTGRAAKHMTEITGSPSSTIHKLLGISQMQQWTKKEKLPCDMLICDEASMLNLDITFELLSRIETGTVVYFVGDKDQLPAVGPGNVLHDIIDSGVVPVYHLTKVYRQDGIILENAHLINTGVLPTQTNALYQTETFDDAAALKTKAIELFKKLYDPKEPFETQILVPSYKTECGIIALNEAIQSLNSSNIIYASKTYKCIYKKHDKILMIRNHKDGLYQNGSVGIFLENLGDEFVVEFDGEETHLPKSAIEDMTLGYAVSVHKSQGSEYKHVILCLPDKPANMLTRNIVYTGVTRAKKDIAVLEMKDAMAKAVSTNLKIFMQTGLREKLRAISVK